MNSAKKQRKTMEWERLEISLLFSGTLYSVGYNIFLPGLLLLSFPQLFVNPPQTTTLPSCISFAWGWFFCFLYKVTQEGNGTPLQYSCLENPMDGGAWQAAVHGVAKSQTRLSDFTFTFHSHALEKEMATHSSVLAWRIPGTGEPGGLPSMGSHRVRHD